MEFLDNVKEKAKSQGFVLSVVTSALILCANKFSTGDVKEIMLFFTPQISAALVFASLSAFSFILEWRMERKTKNHSNQSEELVKKNIEMLNIAKTNGLADEELAAIAKVASQSVSAHMQMNLNRISEINNKEDESIKQKRYMVNLIKNRQETLEERFNNS